MIGFDGADVGRLSVNFARRNGKQTLQRAYLNALDQINEHNMHFEGHALRGLKRHPDGGLTVRYRP